MKKRKPPDKKISNELLNEDRRLIANGLADVLGFSHGEFGTQLNQVDTLFKNNRWYLVSNMRQLLSEIYVEHGLIQTVVNVPVDDGLRGGVIIKSKQLSAEEIEKLTATMEEKEDLVVVGQALKWNRLFGGAGVMVLTDQKGDKPLDINSITEDSPLEFRDVDMWELFWSQQNTSDYATAIDEGSLTDVEYYDYYGQKVHKSRVFKMKGLKAPSFVRPRLRGWGFSIVEALINSMNQYLKANNLIFEVLDEFKIDVFKIKNLTNSLLSPEGAAGVKRRIALANAQKNYQNAITMDGEDDYLQKELSFAGIAETMHGIRMQIASDLRMPLTKVFGISAAGFSSGEDDIENYNAMVESQVRQKCKFDIMRIIKIRCQQMFGLVPEDLTIEFKPLRVLSSEQEENVKTQKFSRILQTAQAGLMTVKEFKDACNKENLLSIQVDTSIDKLETGGGDEEGSADAAPAGKKSATQAPEAKS